ncbi:MerR family DNA-binding transcriptional regulator, partial [Pseudomonas aeruginosa]|uniref:MerR family DNA-binding transcriptional regulator n=1 Tax=Pseudomonas aeruginosa TaxID=287 RepID=UPI0021F0B8E1
MKIGELAKLTGLATSRIRFYEASGLIRSQRKANGYRDYAADTVWILELVTGAPRAGVDPGEVSSRGAPGARRRAAPARGGGGGGQGGGWRKGPAL